MKVLQPPNSTMAFEGKKAVQWLAGSASLAGEHKMMMATSRGTQHPSITDADRTGKPSITSINHCCR